MERPPFPVKMIGPGKFTLPNRNVKHETYLNENYIQATEPRAWYLDMPAENSPVLNNPIVSLGPIFRNRVVSIVGKGPSLDHLKSTHFTNPHGPVFAINEAVHKVEGLGIKNQIILLQQDFGLGSTCTPSFESTIPMISIVAEGCTKGIKNRFIYNPHEYQNTRHTLSVLVAISIAKQYGAVGFRLYCFDACVSGNTGYASVIGYEPTKGGNPKRFLSHRKRIDLATEGYQVEWIIPTESDAI